VLASAAVYPRALALYACFGVTVLCVARLVIPVALMGGVQTRLYSGAIYGFSTPMTDGMRFGPLVSTNALHEERYRSG
jgi:hypothetical protein